MGRQPFKTKERVFHRHVVRGGAGTRGRAASVEAYSCTGSSGGVMDFEDAGVWGGMSAEELRAARQRSASQWFRTGTTALVRVA